MGTPRRVVITGMGVVTALGDTLDAVLVCALRGAERGRAVDAVRHDRVQGPLRRPGARLGPRGPLRGQGSAAPRPVRAVRHGGQRIAPSPTRASTSARCRRTPCGVIIGSGIGGLNEFETQHSAMMQKGPSRISPFTIPKLMVNAASGQVSIRWGLRGPNSAVATACAVGGQRHRRRLQDHPGRPRRRDDHRRQRGGDHAHGPRRVRRDARALDPQRRPAPRQPSRSTATATASSWPRGPAS